MQPEADATSEPDEPAPASTRILGTADTESPAKGQKAEEAATDSADSSTSQTNTADVGTTTPPPLLPSQALNGSPLYASALGSSAYPTDLNAPSLYNTGAFSLSQIAVNDALQEAFLGGGIMASNLSPDQSPSPLDRIELGPINFKCALNLSLISDDNIDAQPAGPNRVSDVEYAITPAVLFSYGTQPGQRGFASLVYAPTILRFLRHSDEDSDNQNVALSLQYPFDRLTLDAGESFTQTTGVNLDARARTTQATERATFGGSYDIDDKLTAQSHVEYLDTTYTSPEGTINSFNSELVNETRETWSSAAVYTLNEKLNFGPQFNLGLETPENSPQQTFEQGLLNFNYQATNKILVDGQAGIEWRQYTHGVDRTNPVFTAGVTYKPTDDTSIAVHGFRNVTPTSDASDETDVNTGVAVTLGQRLFQRLALGFTFNYLHTDYLGNGGPLVSGGTGAAFVNTRWRKPGQHRFSAIAYAGDEPVEYPFALLSIPRK